MKYFFSLSCVFIMGTAISQTSRINFTMPEFYPEGIAYNNKNNLFYTGSVKTGTIVTVSAAGKVNVLYEDASLKSSFGMKIDSMRNCLWVCTGDPNYSIYADSTTYKKKMRLIALDLGTGKKVKDFDLTYLRHGWHFANDLTLDNEGNIYITDSYSPAIYRVDKSGATSIWSENELFGSLDIGLNGIVWHPGGYLLAVNNGTGDLLKIPLSDPKAVQKVKVNTFFPGADGLLIDNEGHLILVQNKGVNKVFQLKSTDDFQTATVVGATATEDRFQQPSTVVLQKGKLWVVNSKLNEIQDPGVTPSKEFSLQLAVLKPVQ